MRGKKRTGTDAAGASNVSNNCREKVRGKIKVKTTSMNQNHSKQREDKPKTEAAKCQEEYQM